jgi:hypothetical protein
MRALSKQGDDAMNNWQTAQRELITRYFDEVWNRGHVEVLDELLDPQYLNHSPGGGTPRPGPAALKPIVHAVRRGIPDVRYEILDMVMEPGKVAVYTRLTGTHDGDYFGIAPTGRRIDVRQMQIEWIREGRIWQHWRVTEDLMLHL